MAPRTHDMSSSAEIGRSGAVGGGLRLVWMTPQPAIAIRRADWSGIRGHKRTHPEIDRAAHQLRVSQMAMGGGTGGREFLTCEAAAKRHFAMREPRS